MKQTLGRFLMLFIIILIAFHGVAFMTSAVSDESIDFPRDLEGYGDEASGSYFDLIQNRLIQEPFNGVATLIFFLAITHTMLVGLINKKAHQFEHNYEILKKQGLKDKNSSSDRKSTRLNSSH